MKIKKLRRLNEDLDTNTLVNDILKYIGTTNSQKDVLDELTQFFPYLIDEYIKYVFKRKDMFTALAVVLKKYIYDYGLRDARYYYLSNDYHFYTLGDVFTAYDESCDAYFPDKVEVDSKLDGVVDIASLLWDFLLKEAGWYQPDNKINALFKNEKVWLRYYNTKKYELEHKHSFQQALEEND